MPKKSSVKKDVFSWVVTIGVAILIAFLFRTYVAGNFIVSGISMMPNFHNGDRLFINKMDRGINKLKDGDVIVFRYSSTQDYIKRIIGMPGDTISYKQGNLYRNSHKVAEPYLNAYKKKYGRRGFTIDFSLAGLTGHSKVPKNELWVMGDNRKKSYDSRFFKFVSVHRVIGKVELRYWPWNRLHVY